MDARLPTVLIVEDDDSLRWMTKRLVERECGFHVVGEAVNGAHGVELAAKLLPDVVLLDLGMPVMDGFTALPLIKSAAPTTRVIVYSGRAPEEAQERSLALGAVSYVEKDPSSRRLVEALCVAVHEAASLDNCICGACCAEGATT